MALPRPRSSARLDDEVFHILGDAILTGTLEPGQRVRDADLATEMGVSRTPVREALQRLERLGLIEVSPNRYTRVSVPDDKARFDTFEFVLQTLGLGMQLALPRCADAELAVAVAHADAMVAAARADDADALEAATEALYRHAAVIADNAVFRSMMKESALRLLRNVRGWPVLTGSVTSLIDDVTALRDAIAVRDAATAEIMLRRTAARAQPV